ncbi:MAG: transposase [Solirubrobacterales bacterium]
MNAKATARTVEVTADGGGLVSHAGAFLLAELADRTGLTKALSEAMAATRERRSAHDPAASCATSPSRSPTAATASDLGVLRSQEVLFGPVASQTTAHRAIKSIDAEGLDRIRAARASARARAWDAGARPETITLDIDATLLDAHSEKEQAAGTYKRGFGFHPLLCYLEQPAKLSLGSCAPATPARTPPPITSRSSRRRSSRSRTGPRPRDPGSRRRRWRHPRLHRRLPRGLNPLLGRLRGR